jgi:hypothetical protein
VGERGRDKRREKGVNFTGRECRDWEREREEKNKREEKNEGEKGRI